jgi:hypothetical protein
MIRWVRHVFEIFYDTERPLIGHIRDKREVRFLGFYFEEYPSTPGRLTSEVAEPEKLISRRACVIPMWFLMLVPGLIALSAINDLRKLAIAPRRSRAGLCPTCGYDLRGGDGKDRCPECGEVPPVLRETDMTVLGRVNRVYWLVGIVLFTLVAGGLIGWGIVRMFPY